MNAPNPKPKPWQYTTGFTGNSEAFKRAVAKILASVKP